MQRRSFCAALLLASVWADAQPQKMPPEIAEDLPGAQLQGSGSLTFFGLRIYEAALYSTSAKVGADWAAVPLALAIECRRNFSGTSIANRTLAEMRRLATIDETRGSRWLAALKSLFPDFEAGDRLTGVQRPGELTRLHHNGRPLGELRDAEFTRLFFGIWLSPQTSEPALRKALLGAPT
jgi:hypothetical protein